MNVCLLRQKIVESRKTPAVMTCRFMCRMLTKVLHCVCVNAVARTLGHFTCDNLLVNTNGS